MFAPSDGLKNGPHRHFSLPVANIPHQQPIHRLGGFHIGLDFIDAAQLVRRFHVWKLLVKFFLQIIVRWKSIPLGDLPLRIQIHQFIRNVFDLGSHPMLGFRPFAAPQTINPGLLSFGCDVFLDQVQLGDGNKDLRVIPVIDHNIILVDTVDLHRLNPRKDPNPVINMDHKVPGF